MALVTRNMKIVYGSTEVGGSSTKYLLHGVHEAESDFDFGRVKFRAIVVGAEGATFRTNCNDFEDAFRTPHQQLTVTMAGVDILDFDPDPAQNTGFNAESTWRKVGEEAFDNTKARLYEVEIICERPADWDTDNRGGRRDSKVQVKTLPSGKRRLRVTGSWSAIAGTDAVATYEANKGDFFDAIKTGIDASAEWDDLIDEYERDDQDKTLTFTFEAAEIIFDQSQSLTDHPAIKKPQMAVTRRRTAPGDSLQGTTRPDEFDVVYQCEVDKSQETDLPALWEDTIIPRIINYVKSISNGTQVALIEKAPSPEPTANGLAGNLKIAIYGASTIVESYTTQRTVTRPGEIIDRVYDNNPYAALLRQGRPARFDSS